MKKNCFLQKDSYGNEEFDFDDCTQKFLPEHQKVLIQCPNPIKTHNFLNKNNFFSKCSSGHVEGSLANSTEKLLPEGRKLSTRCPQMLIIECFSQKNLLRMFLLKRRVQLSTHRR